MKWEVHGADRVTGRDRVTILEAHDATQAADQANLHGMLVQSVNPISSGASALDLLAMSLPSSVPRKSKASPASTSRHSASRNVRWITAIVVIGVTITIGLFATDRLPFLKIRARSAGSQRGTPVAIAQSSDLFASTYKVEGAAWVLKKSGDSTVLRGLHIMLINRQISKADAVRAVKSVADDEIKDAENQESQAREWMGKANGTDPSITSFFKDTAEDHAKEARTLRNQAALKLKAAAAFPATVDLRQVFAATNNVGLSEAAILSDQIASATTDVEGKYAIANIPTGNYYLFAWSVNDIYTIQWLVPVHVNSDMHVDLSNDNAIDTHNYMGD